MTKPGEIKLLDLLLQQILDVTEIMNKSKAQQEILEKLYGEKSEKTNVIGKVTTVVSEHLLNLVSTKDTYFENSWWIKNNMSMPTSVASIFIKNQFIHLKFYFFLKFVSTLEAQLRIIVRRIYPGKCNNGTDSFKNIFTFLLTQLALRVKYEEAYEISRVIRNTVHNIGVHTENSVKLTYDKIDYDFIQWKGVDFFSHELNMSLQTKLLESIIEITNSSQFKSSTF